MKRHIILLPLALGLCTGARAQTNQPSKEQPADSVARIEALSKQVQALTETVKALEDKVREQQNLWEGYHAPAAVALGPGAGKATVSGSREASLSELQQEVEQLKAAQQQKRPGLFNPDISATVDFITSYSRQTNNLNFTLRDVELMFQTNIDTYARAWVILNASSEIEPLEKTDVFGEVSVGLEEAAIETTSLPYGLVVKGGQFFADFTRMGKVHPHDRPFVDGPSSVDQIIGGETQARGVEIDWLPSIGHYVRLTGGLVDNIGAEQPVTSNLLYLDGAIGSAYAERVNRTFQSLMAYGRLATQFELGNNAVMRVGGDYAQTSQGPKRQVASGDVKLEWQPSLAREDRLEVGGEYLWTRQSGLLADGATLDGNPNASSSANGGYAYAQYRFGKRWEPGIRLDYLNADSFEQLDLDGDGFGDSLGRWNNKTWTYSAYLTFWASEFNRLRLQVSYVDADRPLGPGLGSSDWQFFLQWTAFLGAHKHEHMP